MTNVSVILSFDISMLISKHANYESSLWREIFISLVDNQITDVSFFLRRIYLEHVRVYISMYFIYIIKLITAIIIFMAFHSHKKASDK